MRVLIIILLIILAFSESIISSSYTLKLIIIGPAEVIVNSDKSFYFITNSSIVNFNDSVKVTVLPSNPSYYLLINGTKYFSEYTATLNKSEVIEVIASPEYAKVKVNLNGTGELQISFSNGTQLTINKSISFYVLNNTLIYISSPQTMEINGVETNFYVQGITNNETINITLMNSSPLNGPTLRPTSENNYLGLALGLIGLSLFLFLKRKSTTS